jgi:hypothetical protein
LNLKIITAYYRFNNETKNYKVYYDGAFYVGEKRFDSIVDLVHDGMISFYIEKHASNYIADMAEENNYAESPYVASKAAFLARQKQSQISTPTDSSQSIHASFQKQQTNSFKIPNQHSQPHQIPNYPTQVHHHFPVNIQTSTTSTTFQQQLKQQMQTNQFMQNPVNDSTNSISTNQYDKENRSFSQLNGSSKSNAIFDRLDIMNSEKPHRFKV